MKIISRPTEKEIRQSLGLRTVTEAAEAIGIPANQLQYHQQMGYCLQPNTRLEGGTRFYYIEDDLDVLRAFFEERQLFERARS